MRAALDSKAIRARIDSFIATFDAQTDLLVDGQFFYADYMLRTARSHLKAAGDSLIADDKVRTAYFSSLDAALGIPETPGKPGKSGNAEVYADDFKKGILQDVSVAAGYKLAEGTRASMSAAVGADIVETIFPKALGGPAGAAKIKAEVLAWIELQTSDLKINTTGTPDSKIWSVYHFIIAYAFAAERCFQSAGRIAKAYGFVKKVQAAQVGTFGLLVDPKKTYADILFRNQNPHVIQYPNNTVMAKTLNNLIQTLDNDIPIRIGVLSGDTLDRAPYPTPEHYLVAIGAFAMPEFGAVVFPFWDPDRGATAILRSATDPTKFINFGFLFAFFEDVPVGRVSTERPFVSTGFSVEDLADKLRGPFGRMNLRTANVHQTFTHRHRYQALSFWNSV